MAEHESDLTPEERENVEQRSAPTAKVVHSAVSRQGRDELDRPISSLFWSGVAAGFAIMASVWGQAALHGQLPNAPWREAVAAFGYTLGFLIVILGRLQLFTEQTMVPILPLAQSPSIARLGRVARLWTAVLVGNLIGAAVISAMAIWGDLQTDELRSAMVDVSAKLLEKDWGETLLTGIPAGFLIASIAWIRSAANENSFWIVLAITYFIGACSFTHVIAGATEAFLLLWTGHVGAGWLFGRFLAPALLGNIIGGTGLFAMLAHAQVKEEI
ncbi:MAG: formate/nitrite transporter family protein [Allosphingosinicella sp.]|uniref:formate/nitrite transporter family protein n=1 Tax=Allosphingosinicella sp. TaxID=2823234 RepID=UPI00393A77DE